MGDGACLRESWHALYYFLFAFQPRALQDLLNAGALVCILLHHQLKNLFEILHIAAFCFRQLRAHLFVHFPEVAEILSRNPTIMTVVRSSVFEGQST